LRSNRGGTDAEKNMTKNGTLGNTSGEMSRRRYVVTNEDRLGAVRKIELNPVIDLSMETETGILSTEKKAWSMLSKAAQRSREFSYHSRRNEKCCQG